VVAIAKVAINGVEVLIKVVNAQKSAAEVANASLNKFKIPTVTQQF
jgi:hypothetical protein